MNGEHFLLNYFFQFHASAGVDPVSVKVMREVVAQNKSFKKENVMVRLQQSLKSNLEAKSRNVRQS